MHGSRHRPGHGFSLLALLLAQAALSAQLSQQQSPTFRAGVQLVRLEVVVTDRRDQPIADLRRENFEIFEGGTAQRIAEFDFVSVPVASRTVDEASPPRPVLDVATNVPASPTSRAFVMVIDDRHLLTHDIISTKDVMRAFLGAIQPDDEVAIVFVGRSDLSTGFTSDSGTLLEAVDAVETVFGFGVGLDPQGPEVGMGAAHHNRDVLDALRNVSRALADSSHARRAVVFVSGGLALDPVRDDGRLKLIELFEISDAAARLGVPIYTLDPRGMVSPEWAVRDPHSLESSGRAPRDRFVAAVQRGIRLQQDRMSEIAVNSGGRAFVNQSDLEGAVEQIVRDAGSFYVLGYYPEPYSADGEFHPVDVKVNRPGVKVRARTGYYATATQESESAEPDRRLADGLGKALPGGSLDLRALASPVGTGTDGAVYTAVTVGAAYDALDLAGGPIADSLHVGVVGLDSDGSIRTSVDRQVAVRAMTSASRVEVTDVLELPRSVTVLRIGVVSRVSGRSGTVHVPVRLPDPGEGGLAVGGLLISVGDRDNAFSPWMSPEAAEHAPFVPSTVRSFESGTVLDVAVTVFVGTGQTGFPDVELSLRRDNRAVRVQSPSCTPVQNSPTVVHCRTALALAGLDPGEYTLTALARLEPLASEPWFVPIVVR